LTAEGVRVLACFAGGALVLLYPELLLIPICVGKAEKIKDNIMMKVDNN
jgi:hypothetical protein